MVTKRLTPLLLALLLATPVAAGEAVISEVRYAADGDFARAGILLGMPVHVKQAEIGADGRMRIALEAIDASGSSAWSGVEMNYSDPGRLLTRVALEGTDRKGYELSLEFAGPVDAQWVPAPDPRLILLKITPRAARAMPVAFTMAESAVPTAGPALPIAESASRALEPVAQLSSPTAPQPLPASNRPMPTATVQPIDVAGSGGTDAGASLESQARAATDAGDYDEAVRLYTRLLGSATGTERQHALEMLGVAREQNRQLAHAKALYQAYLRDYPDTDGARRVQQRLAALLVVEQPRNAPRRTPKRRDPNSWQVSSYLSQFYQRQSLVVDENTTVPIEGVFTDAGIIGVRDGTDVDQEVRVSLSHLLDFTDMSRLDGREFQVSTLYWDGFSERLRSGLRLGRQSRSRAGITGRFDGAVLTHRPSTSLSVDLSGGLLLDYAFDGPDADRPFFGISGEWRSASGGLSIAPFFVQQEFNGILDRRAVGLQSQAQTDQAMLFSLVDYDLNFGEFNNLSLMTNFRVRNSDLSASYEHRKSPYLTTRNALIGQPYGDLSDLEGSLVDLALEDIASDRTATSDTMRLALTTPLSRNWAITTDVVVSDFSKTETSADVEGLDPYQTIYSSVQIRSTDLFGRSSYSALMIRHAESDMAGTTSLFWDNRFAAGESWRLFPRLRVDHRTLDRSGDTQWSTRPSLRLDYRYSRNVRFEFETAYMWTARQMQTRDINIEGLYLRAGYHANF